MPDSKLYPGEQIFDDGSSVAAVAPAGFATGYKAMFRSSVQADSLTIPFPDELLIPEADWEGMIKESEERKTRVSDLVIQAGLPCKDQGQTNFCWANAPVHCLEVLRVIQNQPMVLLSPASVACPINGFRNQGGFGGDALEQLIKAGSVPVAQWPANAIDRRYYTDANKKLALEYRTSEWFNIQPRNLKQFISCLLRRIPVACGYNWQGHETTAYEPVWVNGKIGTRSRNSWTMDWPSPGAGGWYVLQGNKMYPDDAVAPRVAIAS